MSVPRSGLDLAHWAVAVATASLVLWFDELRKLLWRERHPGAVAQVYR